MIPSAQAVADRSFNVESWLLAAPEPWTRYRTLLDLLDRPASDPEVIEARREMLAHPQVRELMATASTWGESPFKRHNDASHPVYALSTLADFGLQSCDPGMPEIIDKVLTHQSPQGAFQSLVNIAPAFGGSGEDQWTWMACDAPTLLYALQALGLGADACIQRAVDHLLWLATVDGWKCAAAPEVGKFRGPGRKSDPCPIATVYALKALALRPDLHTSPAAHAGTEMLLRHWAAPRGQKYYLFGVGSDFRKLKYPFVWYDLLHVADVLSRFLFAHADPRYQQMVAAIAAQADVEGRYTASSMYQSWKGWSFADKKIPSPWLTFLAWRIQRRL
jgi:hypothetical protein